MFLNPVLKDQKVSEPSSEWQPKFPFWCYLQHLLNTVKQTQCNRTNAAWLIEHAKYKRHKTEPVFPKCWKPSISKTRCWAQHFSSPGLLGSCYKPCVQHSGLSVVGDQVVLKLCRNKSTSTLQILPAAFHKGHFYIKHLFAYVVATGDNVQKENKYIS